jgi:hypothetical protein
MVSKYIATVAILVIYYVYVVHATESCPASDAQCGDGNVCDADQTCWTCLAGHRCEDGAEVQCAMGTVQPLEGQDTCNRCVSGTTSDDARQTCIDCAPGTYSPDNASPACINCPQGTWNDRYGMTNCFDCAVGTWSIETGKTDGACTECEKGWKILNSTATGSYLKSNSCVQCEKGKYSDLVGSIGCEPCTENTYSAIFGGVECITCQQGKSHNLQGAISESSCECGDGTKEDGDGNCETCPESNCHTGQYIKVVGEHGDSCPGSDDLLCMECATCDPDFYISADTCLGNSENNVRDCVYCRTCLNDQTRINACTGVNLVDVGGCIASSTVVTSVATECDKNFYPVEYVKDLGVDASSLPPVLNNDSSLGVRFAGNDFSIHQDYWGDGGRGVVHTYNSDTSSEFAHGVWAIEGNP